MQTSGEAKQPLCGSEVCWTLYDVCIGWISYVKLWANLSLSPPLRASKGRRERGVALTEIVEAPLGAEADLLVLVVCVGDPGLQSQQWVPLQSGQPLFDGQLVLAWSKSTPLYTPSRMSGHSEQVQRGLCQTHSDALQVARYGLANTSPTCSHRWPVCYHGATTPVLPQRSDTSHTKSGQFPGRLTGLGELLQGYEGEQYDSGRVF